MKAFVVMGNDYPDAVFLDEEKANRYVTQKKVDDAKNRDSRRSGPSVYWRSYEFEVTQ